MTKSENAIRQTSGYKSDKMREQYSTAVKPFGTKGIPS
jgi:hypothetical protein